jgi:hypothetical protein
MGWDSAWEVAFLDIIFFRDLPQDSDNLSINPPT